MGGTMRNIEIKVRLHDRAAVEARLHGTDARFVAILRQRDVFFCVPHGRLKLRFADGAAELIQYERADHAALRASDHHRLEVADGDALLSVLQRALGTAGEVRKMRQLYRLDNVRIHLDAVEDLGDFLELEAIVDATHDEATCRRAAEHLLRRLEIAPAAFESRAYIDLLRTARKPT
jgi:predicted adenylyl cyclase CyaB